MPEPEFRSVWQKMLLEEAKRRAPAGSAAVAKNAPMESRRSQPGLLARLAQKRAEAPFSDLAPLRNYRPPSFPNMLQAPDVVPSTRNPPGLHTVRRQDKPAISPQPRRQGGSEHAPQQTGRPDYCFSPLYKTLQMGVDLGGFAADAGGAMMGAELLFGEPGLGGAAVESAGSIAALASSFGQGLMGDRHALERVGRDVLSRGALRLVPDQMRTSIGDYLFGKAVDGAIPSITDDPCL